DDVSLSDDEIKLFAKWAVDGLEEGDPAKAPAPKMFDEREGRLARVDMSLPGPSFTTGGPRDQFRCFVLDPQFTRGTFVKGVDFTPGNRPVVHHAIAFLDPGRNSLNMLNGGDSYECFAGPGFNDTSVLSAWAPGAQASEFGNDIALQVPAGALIVLQIHYHPVAGKQEIDQSTLELELFQ